jgi:hypothetical protein
METYLSCDPDNHPGGEAHQNCSLGSNKASEPPIGFTEDTAAEATGLDVQDILALLKRGKLRGTPLPDGKTFFAYPEIAEKLLGHAQQ